MLPTVDNGVCVDVVQIVIPNANGFPLSDEIMYYLQNNIESNITNCAAEMIFQTECKQTHGCRFIYICFFVQPNENKFCDSAK